MMMISTMIVPASVLTIPTYVMFRTFGWIDTYYPLIVPSLFATKGFFVFMMIQFFRGIPKEIDEAAKIDGCNSFQILVQILTPLCKPAIFSVIIFRFHWDFVWQWTIQRELWRGTTLWQCRSSLFYLRLFYTLWHRIILWKVLQLQD